MVQITFKGKPVISVNVKVAAIVTLIIPSLVFLLTHVRLIFALPCSICLAVSVILYIMGHRSRSVSAADRRGSGQISLLTAVSCLFIAALWTFSSGIGGFFTQSSDFNGRNAIAHDLLNNPWPVYFSDTPYALTYYTGYWLVPVGLAKLFIPLIGSGTAWNIMNILQYIETVWMLWIVFVLLITLFRKTRYPVLVLLFFIFFSGLDIIINYINEGWTLGSHLEWWSVVWQYSSSTTCLFWVYNQAVPAWIAVLLLLHDQKKTGYYALIGLSSAIFSPLPLASIAIICLFLFACRALCACRNKEKITVILKEAFSPCNCLATAGVIPILLYLCSNQSASGTAFHFETFPERFTPGKFLLAVIRFDIVEWGIWAALLFRKYRKDPLYMIMCISLFIIPFFRMGGYYNDFVMRASIPALFILMTYCIQYMLDCGKAKQILACLVMTVVFVIGAATPAVEFKRGFQAFMYNDFHPVISDESRTVMSPLEDTDNYVGDTDKAFFYQYLARK